MNAMYVIEWTFTPKDYFEESDHIKEKDYEMWIDAGSVKAEFLEKICKNRNKMLDKLHETLTNKFLIVQLHTHKAFELSNPRMYKLNPDGRKDYFIKLDTAVLKIRGGLADIKVTDKEGNIIADTRRDRINKRKELFELVEKHKLADPIVKKILESYHNAVINPDNELVYLYEIWETIKGYFSDEKKALKSLGLSKKELDKLTVLANSPEIKQGRHRGKQVGNARDATKKELEEARNVARKMFEGYSKYRVL